MSHSNTPPVKKRAPLTTRSSSLIKVCICSRAPHCRTVLKSGQEKTTKASPKKQSIKKYSPGLPRDPKYFRSCLETQRRWITVILESNVTPNISTTSDSFSTVTPIINGGGVWLRMHCARLGDYHSLILTPVQFHTPKVTPLTNHAEITLHELCYCNSNPWGCLQTDQFILQNGKQLRGVQEKQ